MAAKASVKAASTAGLSLRRNQCHSIHVHAMLTVLRHEATVEGRQEQVPMFLNYQESLFQERNVCSVTANTRDDGNALLELAALIPIRTQTQAYPLEQANRALSDLKDDRIKGAAVLLP